MSTRSVIRLFSTSCSKGSFRDRFLGGKRGKRDGRRGAWSFCQHYSVWYTLRIMFFSADQWEGA